jgi:Flp pilus assembly protein TadD/O-antigen ligase
VTLRRAGELGALGLGLVVWSYVAWDGALWDSRLQLVLHLVALAAVAGLLAIGLAGGSLPRTRIDLPLLVLLLAFGVASLGAWNPGLSARALAGILGTALMLPVALVALRHRPGWTAVVVTLPILGLSLGALLVLAWRRLEWILVGAPGLPPVRLGQEGTPFGSVAVPPFVLLAALPIALLIPHRAARLGTVLALLAVGVPLTLVSGSRSAWLAMAVAAIVLVAPGAVRRAGTVRLPRRWTPGRLAMAVGSVALGGAMLAFVAPRLTDVSSLVYRGFLWRDTLAAWSTDPLLGIGPGSMPFARQAYAPALSFPVRQPHSHDVPLGILGDAGMVGLAAALALFVAFVVVAGPWRARSLRGRSTFAVLMGFAAGMLFEDLTFLPGFNLLVILLAAMALTDAGAVRWQRPRIPAPAGTAVAAGAAVAVGAAAMLVVVALGDAAAVAYRQGTDAAGEERWTEATDRLVQATALDPWQPTGPKALAVAADRAGEPDLARTSAARAVELNPGDGASWTNLALLCLADGDTGCARHAADRAVDTATAPGRELANAALVYEALGDPAAADDAYRLSLLTNYWTGLTLPWPRTVEVGSGTAAEIGAETAELNLLIGRRTNGEEIDPDAYHGVYARTLALAMSGDRAAAEEAIQRAMQTARASPTTWELAALLARHYGRDATHLLEIGDVARGSPLAEQGSRPAYLVFDIATFRAYPADGLVAAATRLLPDTPWPWVLDPLLATPAAGAG